MRIKKFESFSGDEPYEKKTPKDWERNRAQKSVDLNLDDIFEICDYFYWDSYIRIQTRKGTFPTFKKDEIKEIIPYAIGNNKIFCFYLDWTYGFFKDDDEWWWFRRNEEIFRCDELSGLKVLLDDLGLSKKSEYI